MNSASINYTFFNKIIIYENSTVNTCDMPYKDVGKNTRPWKYNTMNMKCSNLPVVRLNDLQCLSITGLVQMNYCENNCH